MIGQLKSQIQEGRTQINSQTPSPSMNDLTTDAGESKIRSNPNISRQPLQHPRVEVDASLASLSTLKKSIPKLTTEKAKAFEIFKNGYPSGPWIDGQKQLLKNKYSEAKALGENAQKIRNEISEAFVLTIEAIT
jgi:hypothetical protein